VPAHRQAAPAIHRQPAATHRHAAASTPRRRSRIPLIVLGVVLALAVAGGAAALVVTFLESDPKRNADPTAGPSAPSPIRLTLDDRGATVTLTWTDPSGGEVPFLVTYGRADGPADKTQRVAAGTTTLAVNQLNPALDYCFTVAGDEPAAGLAPSPTICTKRAGPSAGASSTGG
jgi:hypothetical protein